MNKENVYFDIGAYTTNSSNELKENFRDDLTALTLENAEAPLEERITPYEISFNKEGDPNFKIRWETKTDYRENEALFKVRDLIKAGSSHLLWISPPSEEIGYKESRMVIFINKGEDKGVLNIECRGICSEFGEEECLSIAKNLGKDFNNGEVLRSNPLEFQVEGGKDWISALEKIIEMPKVWQAIRKGEDLINKKEKEKVVEEVVESFMPRVRSQMSDYKKLLLGSQIEKYLVERGVNLQTRGSCGISNSEALKLQGSFNVVFQNSLIPGVKPEGYNYFCATCGCWCKDKICPLCKLKCENKSAA